MVRKYIKLKAPLNEEKIQLAVTAVNNGTTVRKASKLFQVTLSVLQRELKGIRKRVGNPRVFAPEEEDIFVAHLNTVADYGIPVDKMGLRIIAQKYLIKMKRNVLVFKDNLPGTEWADKFLSRHKNKLSFRMSSNIKRVRAAITEDQIRQYIGNLLDSLDGVNPNNVMNYDETNFTDDPGSKKAFFRRGCKYPTNVQDFTKSSTSVMFAATREKLLPTYVVFKATNMYDTWTEGGPDGALYNRSKSGWFDAHCFRDWFYRVVVPWARSIDGKCAMIGDNLSTHLDPEIIAKAQALNIQFVCLPPNSTHLTQPLDVAVFGPKKRAWRNTLGDWKKVHTNSSVLPKQFFPSLLKKTLDKMTNADTLSKSLKSGFRTCGLAPVDAHPLLKKLPKTLAQKEVITKQVGEAVIEFLAPPAPEAHVNKRKKTVKVAPGKAVTSEEVLFLSEQDKNEKEALKLLKLQEKRDKLAAIKEKKKKNKEITGATRKSFAAKKDKEGGKRKVQKRSIKKEPDSE